MSKMTEKQGSMISWKLRGDGAQDYLDKETRAKIMGMAESCSMNSFDASDVIAYLNEINDYTEDNHRAHAPKLAMALKSRISSLNV